MSIIDIGSKFWEFLLQILIAISDVRRHRVSGSTLHTIKHPAFGVVCIDLLAYHPAELDPSSSDPKLLCTQPDSNALPSLDHAVSQPTIFPH